jgi:hypothetical protein
MNRVVAGVMACVGLALSPMAAVGEEKAAAPSWGAEVAPSNSSDGITLDAHQKDLVDKVSGYFSGINTLQGSFLQTDSENRL